MPAPRVAVVDGQPIFRAGVCRALHGAGDIEIGAEGGDAADALALASDGRHDMILMDLDLPGGGLDTARAIVGANPDVKLVVH